MRASHWLADAASARFSAGSSPPYSRSTPRVSKYATPSAAGLDGEARVLERADDLLPGLLGRGRVGLDEHEPRAGRERLAEAHPRPTPAPPPPPSPARAAAPPRLRRERRRAQGERRLRAQRRLQLEPGDGEAGDHGNVCSTRTHVPLSSLGIRESEALAREVFYGRRHRPRPGASTARAGRSQRARGCRKAH